ncbi:hypothetical protein LFYK43_05220 [Ligilactobacillus salitolerans]|uniref:Glycosyl hydrolase family 13 catalytic domain-containing protein n=1 Tax=Ligilactobacillus salitolerans TaxID=1808352 RepID=A0A401IRA1_9LACO|nr:hypothetical protein LFYK43_05220 [Ligilactobacillus salitolerans]
MAEWQDNVAWNALYLNNHDQPRAVSRFGNDSQYRKKSAEMLAMVTFLQKGTPFIFQGEEIGMTNCKRQNITDFQDVEALNIFENLRSSGLSADKALELLNLKSRDNSRTPMQWNSEKNAGFSTHKPWIAVNNNYQEINTEADRQADDSIFSFYQKLIALRSQEESLTEGKFQLISADDSEIFAYVRALEGEKILIIGSFADKKVKYNIPAELKIADAQLLLSNYPHTQNAELQKICYLQPYECLTYKLS